MGPFIGSPTFSAVKSRLSLICCSVSPSSLEPAVAHVLHAVAAQAVVDVELGAALQADQIGRLVRRFVEPVAGFRAEHRERREEHER